MSILMAAIDVSGWTALDTLYEVKGFQIAAGFFTGKLFNSLVALMFAIGLTMTMYQASIKGEYRGVFHYILWFFFMLWLIAPMSVQVRVPAGYTYDATLEELVESAASSQTTKAEIAGVPRIMAFGHYAVDTLTAYLIASANSSFQDRPFATERTGVLLVHSRIEDSDLRQKYHIFVVGCFVPVLAVLEAQGTPLPEPYHDPFKIDNKHYKYFTLEGLLPHGTDITDEEESCEVLARSLQSEITLHVEKSPDHADTRDSVLEVLKDNGSVTSNSDNSHGAAVDVVVRYIIHNETVGLLSTNETKAMQSALPDYKMFSTKSQSSSNSGDSMGGIAEIRTGISWVIKAFQSVDQWINHQGEAQDVTAVRVVSACDRDELSSQTPSWLLRLSRFRRQRLAADRHWL